MTDLFGFEDFEERDEDRPYPRAGNRGIPSAQCLCGRFAKHLGGRDYYNGSYTCYSYDVECSRCGVVTVECV